MIFVKRPNLDVVVSPVNYRAHGTVQITINLDTIQIKIILGNLQIYL